eukprot:SAG22_NODE_2407_length_2605_cov_1.483639_1_plen_353_part_10
MADPAPAAARARACSASDVAKTGEDPDGAVPVTWPRQARIPMGQGTAQAGMMRLAPAACALACLAGLDTADAKGGSNTRRPPPPPPTPPTPTPECGPGRSQTADNEFDVAAGVDTNGVTYYNKYYGACPEHSFCDMGGESTTPVAGGDRYKINKCVFCSIFTVGPPPLVQAENCTGAMAGTSGVTVDWWRCLSPPDPSQPEHRDWWYNDNTPTCASQSGTQNWRPHPLQRDAKVPRPGLHPAAVLDCQNQCESHMRIHQGQLEILLGGDFIGWTAPAGPRNSRILAARPCAAAVTGGTKTTRRAAIPARTSAAGRPPAGPTAQWGRCSRTTATPARRARVAQPNMSGASTMTA